MPPEDQNVHQNGQPLAFHETKHGRLGPTLAILLLLLILIFGGLFLRGSILAGRENAAQDAQDVETTRTPDEQSAIGAGVETSASHAEEDGFEAGTDETFEVQ